MSMIDWTAVPVFGAVDATMPHIIRPSAYALIARHDGQLAVVRTPTGVHLPGGGLQPDESAEAGARREAREETGLTIRVGSWRRAAVEHVAVRDEGFHFEKRAIFCDAAVVGPLHETSEADHRLVWLATEQALRVLTPPSHRWAVAEWVGDESVERSLD